MPEYYKTVSHVHMCYIKTKIMTVNLLLLIVEENCTDQTAVWMED